MPTRNRFIAAFFIACAAVCMVVTVIHAQPDGAQFRIGELERRINVIDEQKLSERMARLETLGETNNKLLLCVLGAVTVMLIERAARLKKT